MSKTPKTTIKKGSKTATAEKTMDSGKKLVQARLPFKIIAADSATTEGSEEEHQDSSTQIAGGHKQTTRQEIRKRKLSYEIEEVKPDEGSNLNTGSKENLTVTTKKKKIVEKEVEHVDDVQPVSDELEDENESKIKRSNIAVIATPLSHTLKIAGKRKSAGRPHTKSQSPGKGCTATAVQIKLPLSAGKKNRRKKAAHMSIEKEGTKQSESSDDFEGLAEELNPQKRLKVSESMEIKKKQEKQDPQKKVAEGSQNQTEGAESSKSISNEESELYDKFQEKTGMENEVESDQNQTCTYSIDLTNENELQKAKNKGTHSAKINIKAFKTPNVKIDSPASDSASKKNLTPKQLKLIEQRRKVREEKERKLQEEKTQKQREKEEKELSRKREREEKDEQRRKEREEKDEQKRKERDEKERKRLAEIEVKNEEKRKRNETREEENRKKEEERKRKEQEREEAEIKKKKAAEAFTKFFVAKPTRSTASADNADKSMLSGIDGNMEALAFRPFQRKGDMELAPVCRVVLSVEARRKLDTFLPLSVKRNDIDNDSSEKIVGINPVKRTQLYLSELKSGKITPGKCPSKPVKVENDDDDILIVEDDLERAGQAIFEGTHSVAERHRAKFYKFYENRRPPYFGTWRKKTNLITPRRPFSQDKKYFDYDLESDLEWEEEEPGESLDGSDDDKEKESEDDDYEVDNEWFVPHGHLSDEEMQNEEEIGFGDDNTREAQKAKLKILQQEFAQEMKKKTEKIKPRLLGSIWVDENGRQPELCPKIIWDSLNQRAMLCATPPLVEEPEVPDKNETSSPNGANGTHVGAEKTADKLKPIALTEQMLKDLIRLVHGNSHSKAFLIKEFIAYVEANEDTIKNGDARGPLKSVVRERIDEFAEWQITEAKTSSSKKKKSKKRLCWVASKDVLNRMDLENLGLDNTWQYILQPKFINSQKESNTETVGEGVGESEEMHDGNETGVNVDTQRAVVDTTQATQITSVVDPITCNRNLEITNFTKVLTAEEKNHKEKQQKSNKCKNLVIPTPAATIPASTNIKIAADSNAGPKVLTPPHKSKKHVQLLKTTPRAQQILHPIKNVLISKYLKSSNESSRTNSTIVPDQVVDDDDVIMID